MLMDRFSYRLFNADLTVPRGYVTAYRCTLTQGVPRWSGCREGTAEWSGCREGTEGRHQSRAPRGYRWTGTERVQM